MLGNNKQANKDSLTISLKKYGLLLKLKEGEIVGCNVLMNRCKY
jgi:hypothetical protein